MARPIAVLDIGSSKVVCLICALTSTGLSVQGAGTCEYQGFKPTDILPPELPEQKGLSVAIRRAISQASHEARLNVRSVVLGVSAPFLKTTVIQGELFSKKNPHTTVESDEDRLIDVSLRDTDMPGFTRIHSTAVRYFADDAESASLPVGTPAHSLSAQVAHVYIEDGYKNLVLECLSEQDIGISGLIGVPLAQSLFLVPQDDAEAGALLVDVGYTHTDVSLVVNRGVTDTAVIPVGGKHLASDLAYCLKLPLNITEGIKQRFVFGLDYSDSVDSIRTSDGGTVYVEEDYAREIIEARAIEIGELIRDAALDMGFDFEDENRGKLYMTGGGLAMMRGSSEFLEKQFGIAVVQDMPTMPRYSSHNYVSAFAVADLALSGGVMTAFGKSGKKRGFLGNIFNR